MNWTELDLLWWEFVLGSVTALGYLATLFLVPRVLLTKKRWPASTVAWLMAIITLPVIGGLCFLVFGIDRMGPRVRRRREVAAAVQRSPAPLNEAQRQTLAGLSEKQQQLLRLAEHVGQTVATVGNRVRLFRHTPPAIAAIRQAIADAERSIHLEYYIWQPDRIGTELRDLLIEKARQGVAVRFLYDSVGSLRLTSKFLQPMRDAGIRVAAFLPGRSLAERWSINFRSHRKIVVVDGAVGFTGGMNIGDEYLGRSKHFGYWRDTHLRLEGPSVQQLQDVFSVDWLAATGEELAGPELFPPPQDHGRIAAQVVAGGPDCEPSVFHSLMFAAITEAREQILLATSYFVPTPALCEALTSAGLRGVRTRILVSGPVTYWTTYHAGRSFYDELLAAGVEVYEYRRGQQHAKTLTIDGCWSMVGTPNFDPRSVFLNFEVGVVMYDAGTAEELEHHFADDIQHAVRMDAAEWSRRSTWERLKENACRMFAPVL